MRVTQQYVFAIIFLYLFTVTRSLIKIPGYEWPLGIVSYYIDSKSYDYIIARKIRMAMNSLESVSCVKFRPLLQTTPLNFGRHPAWINFTNPQRLRECVHDTELKSHGEIIVVIGWDCLKAHEILHALLHSIGFKDEVRHPKRDQYIRVMWGNIQPAYRGLYKMRIGEQFQKGEYDSQSIMQFHDRAFSINGRATVIPLVPGLLIKPSKGLSQLDKMALREYFNHECLQRKIDDMMDTCKMMSGGNDKHLNKTKDADYAQLKETSSKAPGSENSADDADDTKSKEKSSKAPEDNEEKMATAFDSPYDLNERNPDNVDQVDENNESVEY